MKPVQPCRMIENSSPGTEMDLINFSSQVKSFLEPQIDHDPVLATQRKLNDIACTASPGSAHRSQEAQYEHPAHRTVGGTSLLKYKTIHDPPCQQPVITYREANDQRTIYSDEQRLAMHSSQAALLHLAASCAALEAETP